MDFEQISLYICPHCRKRNCHWEPDEFNYGPDTHGIECWHCSRQFFIVDLSDYLSEDESPHITKGRRLKNFLTDND